MQRLLLILFSLFIAYSTIGSELRVGKNQVFHSIEMALKMSQSGDTIFVEKGIYIEPNLLIQHPISLIGINYPTIENNKQQEIITVESDSVSIIGLHLQNIKVSYINDYAAIKVNRQKHCVFENNRLENTFFGIFLKHSKDCIIRNNYIKGNAKNEMSSGNAVHLWYCKNILVEKNQARNHRDGIYLEFVDNSIVKNNIVADNIRYGLHFMFSDHDEYRGNTFRSNGAGVAVMFSKYIKMQNNHFEFNWGSASYGLLLKDITDSEITNNIFKQNTIAIYMEGANRVDIHKNEFNSNGWAMKIYGSSMYNKINQNNFLNNSFELGVSGKSESNNFDGNYWSSHTGYDLNKDGTADIPYRPVKLFSRIISRIPSTSILMRSLLIDIIDFAEKVNPVLTPDNLKDHRPSMKIIDYDKN
ncbi:nitrous oxide reductase family maturation protein NosD [Ancylomarina salipaludis]|uniref:Nitrous oxide reductase family maturation protein NosD n=1 Tax=Ancylomarina salipaludis TaxID=2501299 RepID=A0A4Q1JNZ5_9BACT|nr:nitrous oxide reductase family maturation protein NosD [Ancylomarina salipaludis]RXQ96605.1 nitrous oxide reductase family maturation protein NosD [Ancylomarina salipaludis]